VQVARKQRLRQCSRTYADCQVFLKTREQDLGDLFELLNQTIEAPAPRKDCNQRVEVCRRRTYEGANESTVFPELLERELESSGPTLLAIEAS
jgi:hypothetical protein